MGKKQRKWNLIILSLLLCPILVPPLFKEINYRIKYFWCFGSGGNEWNRIFKKLSVINRAYEGYGDPSCLLLLYEDFDRNDKRTEEEKLEDKLLGGTYYSPPPKKIDSETYSEMGKAGYLQRADNHFKNGSYYLAIKDYRKALSQQDNYMKISNAEIINKIGICFYKRENYNKAMDYFTRAINSDSSKAQFFYNRGLARKKLGYANYAQEDFKKAKELAK